MALPHNAKQTIAKAIATPTTAQMLPYQLLPYQKFSCKLFMYISIFIRKKIKKLLLFLTYQVFRYFLGTQSSQYSDSKNVFMLLNCFLILLLISSVSISTCGSSDSSITCRHIRKSELLSQSLIIQSYWFSNIIFLF